MENTNYETGYTYRMVLADGRVFGYCNDPTRVHRIAARFQATVQTFLFGDWRVAE